MIRRSASHARCTPPRLTLAMVAAAAGLLASSGCGYRIVRRDDLRVQKLAADSTAMVTLQRQIATLQARCRADSVRAAADHATLEKTIADHPPTPPADSAVKARDAEIASLKDQLSKANAELDRIKRRLANPRS